MKHHNRITVKSSATPVVEFDYSVRAWYIRFSKKKVAKTISDDKPGVVVAIDFDDRNEVVGVELLGVKEFTISMLLKIANVRAPNVNFENTRFVPVSQSLVNA
jgi:uncharacterized protein YuzE